MEIKEKQVTEMKIIGAEHLDPITVYIDERKVEGYEYPRYEGRIVILCYGLALNYFWGAMGSPMKEFFCIADTGYIASKFEQNAQETLKPSATTGYYDENDEWQTKEVEANIEMADYHRQYICRIIEAVKKAFRTQLEENINEKQN